MAVETLRPSGVGNETNLSIYAPNTGEANWEDVDEAVADDMTTALRTTDTDPDYPTFKRDLYDIPAHSVGSGTINNVTIYWRIRGGLQTTYSRSALRTYATSYNGAENSQSDGATWHDWSEVYTTNPNSGVAWTWTEIDAMEIGVSAATADESLGSCYPTQVYVEIDYTAVTPKTSSDTGAGVEAIGNRDTVLVDTGHGSDAFSDVLATTTASETGSGADVSGGIGLTSLETGIGTEAIGDRDSVLVDTVSGVDVSVGGIGLTASDSGVGTDRIRDYVRGFMWRLFNTFTGRTINTHTGLRTYSTHTGRNLTT